MSTGFNSLSVGPNPFVLEIDTKLYSPQAPADPERRRPSTRGKHAVLPEVVMKSAEGCPVRPVITATPGSIVEVVILEIPA